jgi:hypothetical protein
MWGRRSVLRKLVAVGGMSALAACLEESKDPTVPNGDPSERPARQHAWNDRLQRDDDGNFRPPRHHVYLSLSYVGDDIGADRQRVESTLTDLEYAFEASHEGLLFTVGYSASYFDHYGQSVPVDPPEPIVPGENVSLDEADAFVHLASDGAAAVLEAEEALVGQRETANGVSVTDSSGVWDIERRRTGFFGFGAPAERRHLNGLPETAEKPNPVPDNAPFFMGFRSGFRRNQAPEDRVTISEGRFTGGTTEHVAGIKLNLSTWYDLDSEMRVRKLFSPEQSFEAVGSIGSKLTDHNGVEAATETDVLDSATDAGIVGHAQKLSRVRQEGRPPILRRDVNSDDLGEAGVVFVSLQRDIETFVRTRLAMAGLGVAETDEVGRRKNNGILEYLDTRHRGNFLVPPRAKRALPE